MKTYYTILGISENASSKEIKTAYKALMKKYHPDVYKGDLKHAEKISSEINVAYDVLGKLNKDILIITISKIIMLKLLQQMLLKEIIESNQLKIYMTELPKTEIIKKIITLTHIHIEQFIKLKIMFKTN